MSIALGVGLVIAGIVLGVIAVVVWIARAFAGGWH